MKVQIIQLESEDDHASTRDRLSSTRAEKAVLVWPRSGRPLARRLDLILIQRHARRMGLQLGLVSFDPEVRANANRIGLPVFESLEQLPAGPWLGTEPEYGRFRRRDSSELTELRQARDAIGELTSLKLDQRGRAAAVALVSAALAAVVLVVLPGAEIGVEPTAAELNSTIELMLDPSLQSASSSLRLPAVTVTTQVSGQMQLESSGRTRVPEAAAAGKVEVTNLTGDRLSIPAGTGLRAGDVRFLTSEDLELEGEPATVAVVAAQSGRAGNVAAEAINSVEGPLGFLVQVSNPLPTSGGRDVLAEAVSEDDRQRLQTALMEQLLEEAESVLAEELGDGRRLAPGTVRMTRLLEQQFDREAGELASELSLLMTLEVEGLRFDLAQAERAIGVQLADSVPAGRFVVPGSLVFTAVDAEPNAAGAVVLFRVKAAEARQIDLVAVRRAARGAAAGTIGEVLENRFRLAGPATVDLRPAWLPWMPLLEMRIGVDWTWNRG